MEYKVGQVITLNDNMICVISAVKGDTLHVINKKGEVAKIDINKFKITTYNHALTATMRAVRDGLDYIINNDNKFQRFTKE